RMNGVEMKRLAMQLWRRDLSIALKFPREHRREVVIVAQRFAFGRLMFLAEMRAARFVARERVNAHQLGELEEIGYASGALKRLIKVFTIAGHADLVPEFFAERWNFSKRFFEPRVVARHAALVPE